MFATALVAFGIGVVLMGLLAMLGFHLRGGEDYDGTLFRIKWSEFVAVSIVLAAFVIPSVMGIGNAMSVQQLLTYQQFVNGVEVNTTEQVRTCEAGHSSHWSGSAGQSNCEYDYVSGHYYWEESHTRTVCSGSGKNETCTSETYYTTERANIYTPYASREHFSYTIESSMGAAGKMSYTFPGTYLDANPVPYPGSTQAIPDNIPRGAPADWADADARLKAGDPRAVTKMADYDNYILASDDQVLKTYGARLDEFLKEGLLPDHTANINSGPITGPSQSQADKVSFVGVTVSDPASWQRAVMRFDAALGMKLQGDLHVVLVDSAKVTSNDSVPYTQALKAYWQSETFGKRALAKNGIVLVLGVSTLNNTITWADASTGMPHGNEQMIQYLRDDLPGKALEPNLIFGTPRTIIAGDQATVTLSTPRGVVESILFDQAPFKRARMSCKDNTCVGYGDLVSMIEPTFGQKTWMVIITSIIALALWIYVGLTATVSKGINRVLSGARSLFGKSGSSSSRDASAYTKDDIDELLRKSQYQNYPSDQHGRSTRYERKFK